MSRFKQIEAFVSVATRGSLSAAARLEGVLWGGADADALAADIRNAFARGPRWRKPERPRKPLLPPLYPEP